MHVKPYKVGSRGSALAQRQTKIVLEALQSAYQQNNFIHSIETVFIKTTGDKIIDRPLADIGGKALFAKEIQQALLRKEIDFAVHSLKDLEHTSPPGLNIAAVLEREDCRDVLITNASSRPLSLPTLKPGAVVGTCSPRRAAQLLHWRPDLKIVPLRGNVLTRLQKLENRNFDAIILAIAGLKRLGLWQENSLQLKGYPYFKLEIMPLSQMLPAAGQGILAIECRQDDQPINDLLQRINHFDTFQCMLAERSLLKEVGGNCHTAIAALATKISLDTLELKAAYFPDYPDNPLGKKMFSCQSGPFNLPENLGQKIALRFK